MLEECLVYMRQALPQESFNKRKEVGELLGDELLMTTGRERTAGNVRERCPDAIGCLGLIESGACDAHRETVPQVRTGWKLKAYLAVPEFRNNHWSGRFAGSTPCEW